VALMREVEWEPCLLEPRQDEALDRRARATLGRGAGTLGYFAALPWLANTASYYEPYRHSRPVVRRSLQ
jgi:hypothetical protein